MTSIRKGANSRKRRSRIAAALAAAGALVMSSGLVMLGGVSASATDGNGNGNGNGNGGDTAKYFVCKYVGTPGVDEHLQPSDQNPISVSGNAIKEDPVVVGSSFADAQGRSYVLVKDTGQDESTLECPAGEQPATVTPQVTFADPCGTAQDTFSVQADPRRFTYDATGTPASGLVSILFTAKPGYVIGGPNPLVLHFTNVACPSYPTTVTPTVTFSDPCGTAQDSYAVVAASDKFTYAVAGTPASGTVTITFTANRGYVIGGPNPLVLHFTNVACPAGPIVVSPAYASAEPPTCQADGSLVLPAQPAGVLVEQQGTVPGKVHLTYSAATGYELTAGMQTDQWLTVAPKKTGAVCGEVEGTETAKPKPTKHVLQPQHAPTVLGTEAFAPTVVDAGLATWPADAPATSSRTLLAQGLVGSGLVLLTAAGWLGFARRERGAHQG